MQLKDLNIGDKFSIKRDANYPDLFHTEGNYLAISPNEDNFKITHLDEWHDMDNYCFVLNLDTSTLGILLKTQEVEIDD
jgi:hypothetical protein